MRPFARRSSLESALWDSAQEETSLQNRGSNEEGRHRCEEVGVVQRVHTLVGGVRSVATALKVVEEVQEEVQEVKE